MPIADDEASLDPLAFEPLQCSISKIIPTNIRHKEDRRTGAGGGHRLVRALAAGDDLKLATEHSHARLRQL